MNNPWIQILSLVCLVLGASACTEELQFGSRTKVNDRGGPEGIQGEGDDGGASGAPGSGNPGDSTEVDDSGGTPPGSNSHLCDSNQLQTEAFSLVVDAIEGANIVFLIDDSGSMSGEFQKVVWELQSFINGILAVTDNNYRMVMIFDTNGAAIRNRTFYRDRNLTDRIFDPNPFIDQIASSDVEYFREETWSKWADMAFARVFMPASFSQTLPSLIPADTPRDVNPLPSSPPMMASSCSGPGKYFRPRDFTSDYAYGSFPCISADQSMRISDYLIPDFNVNLVAISDDDLNVAFDRAQFSPTDPTKNAYPEVVDLLFKDLVRPLGESVRYIYHSIVGPIGSASGPDVDKDGVAHLALSKHSSGASFDIRAENWQPLFDLLTSQIIYSQQEGALNCKPQTEGLEVRFNGILVDSAHYSIIPNLKKISFKELAFEGLDSGTVINVQVRYRPTSQP